MDKINEIKQAETMLCMSCVCMGAEFSQANRHRQYISLSNDDTKHPQILKFPQNYS